MIKNEIDLINDTELLIELKLFKKIFTWMKSDFIFNKEDCCCLKLTNDNDIKNFNYKYRGKNSSTDVLSFPCEFKNIPFKGDIIIDVEIANQQRGTKSIEHEVLELFIHGLLHLAGMDHINKKEQIKMNLYEEKYKNQLSNLLKAKGV